MKKVILFVLAFFIVVGSVGASQAAPNLVGTWAGTIDVMCSSVETGTITMVVDYQEGNFFRGYSSANFGGAVEEMAFTGAISGSKVSINFFVLGDQDGTSVALFDTTVSSSKLKGSFRDSSGCSGLIAVKKQKVP